MRLVSCVLLAAAAPLLAQTPADSLTKLAAMESAAGADADALFKAASFAQQCGLGTEWRRLLTRTLAANPQHEAAHKALGHVKHDGRWMSAAKAEILAQRAAGKEFVGGMWVAAAEADDARRGVFRFAGELVSRDEYLALTSGRVRHPRTGELIDAGDLEKAKNGLFPGDGKWVDEAEANRLHSRANTPWILRTKSCLVVSTMPLKEIEAQASQYVDDAHDFALSLLGQHLVPSHRPVVMLVGTADRFRDLGNQIGGASSAYGAFLAEGAAQIAGVGSVRPAVALMDKNWGVYYLKHAVGLAVAHAYAAQLPGWLTLGVGAYTERFYSREIAAWFGQQYLAAGGLTELEKWFGAATITPEMDHQAMGRQLFQAGLLLAFAQHGRNAEAKKQLDAVCQGLLSGDSKQLAIAVAAFEKGLVTQAAAVRSYLDSLTRG